MSSFGGIASTGALRTCATTSAPTEAPKSGNSFATGGLATVGTAGAAALSNPSIGGFLASVAAPTVLSNWEALKTKAKELGLFPSPPPLPNVRELAAQGAKDISDALAWAGSSGAQLLSTHSSQQPGDGSSGAQIISAS